MVENIRKQSWFDNEAYPFASQYFHTSIGKMHYIDEGKGEVMLFVHGTPAWSFLYRDFIKHFSKTHRCIAADHIGFGLSEKPKNWTYGPQDHAENLEKLIQHLGLKDITLVIHDFGGAIGLDYALKYPANIKKVVLFNTWCWETKSNQEAQKVNKILHSFLGKMLYLNFNFSPKILFRQGFYNKNKLPAKVHQHYVKVFPSKKDRYGLLKIGQSIIGSSDWFEALWQEMDKLADKPFLIIWGMKDEFIKPDFLAQWEALLRNYQTVRLECGHFVQEEMSTEAIQAMQCFLSK
ncbi:MAG: alpha/beta fold hydrolase [Thermoflexibacter sp.]